jgi:D-galactarolactone isomerase
VIRALLDEGKAWVKLSGAYFITKVGPPSYSDATAIAVAFLRTAPERCMWGSNWPPPWPKEPPDDAEIFDLLTTWAPDEATRNGILVSNPEALYGFPRQE